MNKISDAAYNNEKAFIKWGYILTNEKIKNFNEQLCKFIKIFLEYHNLTGELLDTEDNAKCTLEFVPDDLTLVRTKISNSSRQIIGIYKYGTDRYFDENEMNRLLDRFQPTD